MSDQARVSQPDTAQEVLRGLRAAVPVMTGFVPVGLILGATGDVAGLSPFTSGLMCAANLRAAPMRDHGAVEHDSARADDHGHDLAHQLASHHALRFAHALHGQARQTRESLFVLFFLCDEAWALAMQDVTRMKRLGKSNDDAFSLPFYVGCAIALWISWWGSAAVGASIGNDLGDLEVWGFAMAFPAIFHRDPFRDVAGREEVPAVDRELRRCGPHESDVLDPRGRRCRLPSRSSSRLVHDRKRSCRRSQGG